MEIKRGDAVLARTAEGTERPLRALGGVIAGGDFAVVWVCNEIEWDTAGAEDREPEGIPWPSDDVRVADREAVSA
jgi:hypothetical protein